MEDWERESIIDIYLHGECHALTLAFVHLFPDASVIVVRRFSDIEHSAAVINGRIWDAAGCHDSDVGWSANWKGQLEHWPRHKFVAWVQDVWGSLTVEQAEDSLYAANLLLQAYSAKTKQAWITRHFEERLKERLESASPKKQAKAAKVFQALKTGRHKLHTLSNGKYAIQFGGLPGGKGDYFVVDVVGGIPINILSLLIDQVVIRGDTTTVQAQQVGIDPRI